MERALASFLRSRTAGLAFAGPAVAYGLRITLTVFALALNCS